MPLAIRPKIMARYEEYTAFNRRNRSLMTLPGRGRKVLLLAIIPVPRISGRIDIAICKMHEILAL